MRTSPLSVALLGLLVFGLLVESNLAINAGFLLPEFTLHNVSRHAPIEEHIRVRRSVYQALGAQMTCEPGWTGLYCENPLCFDQASPRPTEGVSYVDMVYLKSGCDGVVNFPVEDGVNGVGVTVTTNHGVPNITLTDRSGRVWSPEQKVAKDAFAFYYYDKPSAGPFSVTVDMGGVDTDFCHVEIQVDSPLSVRAGFIDSPHTNKIIEDSANGGQPMYVALHAFNVTAPGAPAAVKIRDVKRLSYEYNQLLTRRYECSFEYYAGFFTCDADREFLLTVDGTDNNGHMFRRTRKFSCLGSSVKPTPPVTPPPAKECYNNGTMINGGTPNAMCFCPELYTGAQCDQVRCMNGGTPRGQLECECAQGFSGSNCQHVTCEGDNTHNFQTDDKSLVIIVRNTKSMYAHLFNLATVIYILDEQFEDLGITVYRSYELVYFANDNVTKQRFRNAKALADAIRNLQLVDSEKCSDSVSKAVRTSLEELTLFNKSPVYVFTDVVTDDEDDYYEIITKNTFKKLPINFFIVQGGACNFDSMRPGARTMDRIARHTGGLVYTPSLNEMSAVAQTAIAATGYHAHSLLVNDYRQCIHAVRSYNTFLVDSSIVKVFVLATGNNLTLAITDPSGATVNNVDTIISDGRDHIWEITHPMIGEYFLMLNSDQHTQPCSFRVIGQSNYDLFYGISTGMLLSYAFNDPIYNLPNHMVAEINNLSPSSDPFKLFAEMSISTTDDQGVAVPLYYSSGVYRDGCSYRLYFGPYVCKSPEQLLYITVYADDPTGATIQRTAVGTCARLHLNPEPSSQCLNGGVPNPLNNSMCICTANYNGPTCANIVCSNNGTAVHGTCECPIDYEGKFCELLTCNQPSDGHNFDYNDRSLAFVISTRQTMQKTWSAIAERVQDMVRNLQAGSPNFIRQYTLITVNQTNVVSQTTTTLPEQFVSSVKAVANSMPTQATQDTSCTVHLEDGIAAAMKTSLPNSYIFAFTDSDSTPADFTAYASTFNAVIEQRTSLFLVITETVCTANGTDGSFSNNLAELVELSAGDTITTNAPEKILDFIPALHNSGLAGVFDSESYDCAGSGKTYYIPVDGWSQSLTLFAHGTQALITSVLLPNGTSVEDHVKDLLHPISVSGKTTIMELVIPCDDEWSEAKGPYCYSWDAYSEYSWKDASARCHKLGGSLADVFNSDKEAELDAGVGDMDAWIGLHRVPGGSWKWDAPDSVNQQAPTTYTNWGTNEPSDANSGKDCVLLKVDPATNTSKWFTAQCSSTALSICQKHRYGQKVVPSDRTKNLLPSGMWAVKMSTSSGSCRLRARVQSSIQVFYEFTTQGSNSDQGKPYGNIKSTSNRFIAKAIGLDLLNPDHDPNGIDGRLNYGFMYKGDKMLTPVTFQPRFGCSYKSVSQNFACPDYSYSGPTTAMFGKYVVKFSGIDQFGNLFERWSSAVCTLAQASCKNGGYEYDGKCVCPTNFYGDDCGARICLNGGVQTGSKCTCSPEFTGESCEFAQCDQQSVAVFNNDQRTLAIVVETTYDSTPTLIALQRQLKSVIDGLKSANQTANWFSNYILYPFDSLSNKDKWVKPTVATTSEELVRNLKNIPLYECPGDVVCENGNKCPRPILTAINETLKHPQFTSPNSVVLVITRSSAEDAVLYSTVEPVIQKSRAQINIILPDVASPCREDFDGIRSNVLFSVASVSGGSVFLMTSGEMVTSFLPTYLPSLYKSSTLNSAFTVDGCQSWEQFFQIDSGTSEFTIDYYAENPSVAIFGPDGKQLPTQPSLITSGNSYLGVYSVRQAGLYRIKMQSPGRRCAVNVRSRSTIEIYAGFTQVDDAFNGATQDDAYYAPLHGTGKKNVALFHADGLGGPGSVLYYAQIMTRRGNLEYTSQLRKREKCTYQYATTRPFDCPEPTFFFVVYGMDSNGHHFARVFQTHCLDKRAPALPGPASCVLADTKTDFVFIVDSSSTNDKASFQIVQNLIANTMNGYQMSSGNTQVAAMTVSDTNHPSFGYAEAATGNIGGVINSKMIYDGNSGQALNDALTYIKDTVSSGNRAGVRHQIVYITSNSNFTNGDPVETVRLLKRGGVGGFITIGYKIQDTDSSVELLAGSRCTFKASTESDLKTYGQNFIQSNSCRQRPICGES